MAHYLYGARVQGIQSYIFETNKLLDIGGASELIESLSYNGFKDFLEKKAKVKYSKYQLLRNAAGEISYLFTDKASCEAAVLHFEKFVATEMPGLTVSQAVVEASEDNPNLAELSGKLNRKLQIQRNCQGPPPELGWMISERARKTGRPGVKMVASNKKTELLDRRQLSKRDVKSDRLYSKILGPNHWLNKEEYALDLNDITGNRERKWLAVVHADGNNLGKLIQKLLRKIPLDRTKEGYRQFSLTLEKATVAAARAAYNEVLRPIYEGEQQQYEEKNEGEAPRLPIRPVIIGGDDLTVILRAENAVDFTRAYLATFEKETQTQFEEFAKEFKVQEYFEHGLTACAGIAIIKPKYPFHYAADLAEGLCSWTKKIAKKINSDHTPSCLHFHKVQASFVEEYADITRQELKTKEGRLLTAGPYFVNAGNEPYLTIDQLLRHTKTLQRKSTPTGPLRDYAGELKVDEAAARQKLKRIIQLNGNAIKDLAISSSADGFIQRSNGAQPSTHLYDALQLHSL